jgi:hypothetical protein
VFGVSSYTAAAIGVSSKIGAVAFENSFYMNNVNY